MRVEFTTSAVKDLKPVPKHVLDKLRDWVEAIGTYGIEEVRKAKGYHDEPLRGDRRGQRSIRLSKAYRAFCIETVDGKLRIIVVIEVNKHDY
jgi:proteic killer suppression protein